MEHIFRACCGGNSTAVDTTVKAPTTPSSSGDMGNTESSSKKKSKGTSAPPPKSKAAAQAPAPPPPPPQDNKKPKAHFTPDTPQPKTMPTSTPSSDAPLNKNTTRHTTPSIREKLIHIHGKAKEHQNEALPGLQEEDVADTGGKSVREGAQRLQNIFAVPLEMDANFQPPVHPKTTEQYDFIDTALSDNFVFDSMNPTERKTFIEAMDMIKVDTDTEIIKQGDIGDYFYIIQSGKVSFTVNGELVGKTKEGGSFGELALLYNCPRGATCVAMVPCELWRVDQNTFRKILASQAIQNDNEIRDILIKVPFLKDLDAEYVNKLIDNLTTTHFHKGDMLVRKGDEGKVFYILKEGTCSVTDIEIGESKYEDQELKEGDYFGERAIVTKEPRAANITATSDGTALCLSRDNFEKILGNINDLILRTQDRRKLAAIPIIAKSKLEPYEINALAGLLDDISKKKNFLMAKEGQPVYPAIYLVRNGEITITSADGKVNVLKSGGYFGEYTINPAGKRSDEVISKYTVTVTDDCLLGMLTVDAIESVIGDISRLSSLQRGRSTKLDVSVKLTDLKRYRILGVGTFGQVWLVSKKGTENAYALKIQNKKELLNHHQVEGVIREKNIMASIDHPFIIKLVNTYQDEKSVYMLLALVQGGELFSVLHTEDMDGVDEPSAKFYAAGILEGLSYMHRRHILYRDLKPENVLIDKEGFPVIVDLGFAKIVMDTTYTLCGTPLYLAPEVILSRGHDKGADHWSLGVLIYEMIVGVTPFYHDGIDQITLFKRIVHGKYLFPSGNIMGEQAKDLVKRILIPRKTQRLGSFAKGDEDIRSHPWLSTMDFKKLVNKEMKAPWVPNIKNPLDVSNFDNWDHMERNDKAQKAPTAREQKKFEGF